MTETQQHEKFMRMAIELAEVNVLENLGSPFGAVIVRNGKVIAKSGNKVYTNLDPTAHAEVAAIRLACKKLNTADLSGAVIYSSSEPCPMCLAAIYWSKIDIIYYGTTKADAAAIDFEDQFIYEEIEKPMHLRSLPAQQLLRQEAQHAFRLWEKSPLKTK